MLQPAAPLTRRLAAAILVAALVAGCYGGGTSPTPGGTTEILDELTRGGVRIESAVAGDPGCDDPSLADNAVHLRVRLPPDEALHDLYLLTFKTASYADEAALVDACQKALHVPPGTQVDRLDVPPYRTFGSGWSPALRDAVTRALSAAARAVP